MKRIYKKMCDQSGASLAVALLFFVFMAVVGSVILSAASASMGRIKKMDEGNQERYALSSAANLLVREISGVSLFDGDLTVSTEQAEYYLTNDDNDVSSKYNWNEAEFDQSIKADSLPNTVKAMAIQILNQYWNDENQTFIQNWNDGVSYPLSSFMDQTEVETLSFTITAGTGFPDYASSYPVNVVLKMNHNLDITMKLSLSDGAMADPYYIKIPFSKDAEVVYSRTGTYVNEEVVRYTYADGTSTGWLSLSDEPQKEISDSIYAAHIIETRTMQFTNCSWQSEEHAVITTIADMVSWWEET